MILLEISTVVLIPTVSLSRRSFLNKQDQQKAERLQEKGLQEFPLHEPFLQASKE